MSQRPWKCLETLCLHTSWSQGPYTTCQGSEGEEFGLSEKGKIQTEGAKRVEQVVDVEML